MPKRKGRRHSKRQLEREIEKVTRQRDALEKLGAGKHYAQFPFPCAKHGAQYCRGEGCNPRPDYGRLLRQAQVAEGQLRGLLMELELFLVARFGSGVLSSMDHRAAMLVEAWEAPSNQYRMGQLVQEFRRVFFDRLSDDTPTTPRPRRIIRVDGDETIAEAVMTTHHGGESV